ncbi:MAG: hypothetical protein M3391_02205 [Actinomycetota bacterium]|nr:hypothetical protein [Actinomycetota bacterium]
MVEFRKPTDIAVDTASPRLWTNFEGEGDWAPTPPKRSRRVRLLTAGIVIVVLAGLVAVAFLWGISDALLIATVGTGALLVGIMIWGLLTIGK